MYIKYGIPFTRLQQRNEHSEALCENYETDNNLDFGQLCSFYHLTTPAKRKNLSDMIFFILISKRSIGLTVESVLKLILSSLIYTQAHLNVLIFKRIRTESIYFNIYLLINARINLKILKFQIQNSTYIISFKSSMNLTILDLL